MGLIIKALACYRISRMLALEEGPFTLFDGLRAKLDDSVLIPRWLARGVACPFCVSFWLGILFYPRRPASALACSAITVILYSLEMFLEELKQMYRAQQKLDQIKLLDDLLDSYSNDLLLCTDPMQRAQLERKMTEIKFRRDKVKDELIEAALNI